MGAPCQPAAAATPLDWRSAWLRRGKTAKISPNLARLTRFCHEAKTPDVFAAKLLSFAEALGGRAQVGCGRTVQVRRYAPRLIPG
eukprot:362274-Chlamydomonas_euryale.AAC.6